MSNHIMVVWRSWEVTELKDLADERKSLYMHEDASTHLDISLQDSNGYPLPTIKAS